MGTVNVWCSASLAWTWNLAKWTKVWAVWTPSGQNVWKVGKTFLEVGNKKIFIVFLYFWEIRKNWSLLCPSPQGSTMAIISAVHMCTCWQLLALNSVQVLQNSGSQMIVLRFTTLWRWLLTKSKRKKLKRAQQYKSSSVSALTGSVVYGCGAAESFSTVWESNPSLPTKP